MKSRLFKAGLTSTLLFTQTLFAFNPLAQDERPQRTFSVPFSTKMATDPEKISHLASQGMKFNDIALSGEVIELSTATRDIEIKFYPQGAFPELLISKGFPEDALNHVHALIGMETNPIPAPEGFGYMYENMHVASSPSLIVGKREYWMSATPEKFIFTLKQHMGQVQQDGLKAVSLKNPEIMKTIDIILNGNSKARKKINQDKFKEVFTLVAYVFSGIIKDSPLGIENSILRPDVSLAPGSKKEIRVKNSRTLKAWLETAGLGLSEDKTYLLMVPKVK